MDHFRSIQCIWDGDMCSSSPCSDYDELLDSNDSDNVGFLKSILRRAIIDSSYIEKNGDLKYQILLHLFPLKSLPT